MATVYKRDSSYCVIYYYTNENGIRKQKWESGYSYRDALKRKTEIEYQMSSNTFHCPTSMTFSEFVDKWLPIHAKSNWQFSTFSNSLSCFRLHIIPKIGHIQISLVTPSHIEELISNLHDKKNSNYKRNCNDSPCISSSTIRHVYLLLKQVFDKAVEWGYIIQTPVLCKKPKLHRDEAPLWEPTTMAFVLQEIKNPLLHLAVHLSFVCSLRLGEILAITLDDIDLINKSIIINKTLQRVQKQALEFLPNHSIVQSYPAKLSNSNSVLISKTPKTPSSCRKVFLSQQLADEIQERICEIKRVEIFYGWKHNNLLFCIPENGGPVEPKLCTKWFKLWQEQNSIIPIIPFHGIRHASVTYKLLLSNGDYKAVQGDTGHKTADVLMNIYAHVQDSNRRNLVSKLQKEFYALP